MQSARAPHESKHSCICDRDVCISAWVLGIERSRILWYVHLSAVVHSRKILTFSLHSSCTYLVVPCLLWVTHKCLQFAVAWSGLTGQAVRSIGFAKLLCNLKQLHIGKLEYWALWIGILASIASSFVIQGVGGGFTEPIPQIPGLVLCYKAQ